MNDYKLLDNITRTLECEHAFPEVYERVGDDELEALSTESLQIVVTMVLEVLQDQLAG